MTDQMERSLGEMQIAPATRADVPEILILFDEAVAWLEEQGLSGQWGTTPFSRLPGMSDRFGLWIEHQALFTARMSGELVGVLAVSPRFPVYALNHLEGCPGPAHYLEAFTTKRQHGGRGIGFTLLRWAERFARQRGADHLLLDCWADNAGLCAYYQRAGFLPCGTFQLGDWRGQFFTKALAAE